MNKKEMVDGLIANEATQFEEKDRVWLEALHEDQLGKLTPVKANEGDPCCPDAVAALIANENSKFEADDAAFLNTLSADQLEKLQPVVVEKVVDGGTKVKTLEEFLETAPDSEMKDQLSSGLAMHKAEKDGLVKKILANARNTFTEDQLKAKKLDELQAIASLAHAPDYSGQGGHGQHHNSGKHKEEVLEAPTINWSGEKKD